MIHDEICTYEVCKLAKEKGFDWFCPHYFRLNNKDLYMVFPSENWSDSSERINAPTQSLLQRWLREEKGLHITVPFDNNEFWRQIKNLANGDSEYGEALGFDTYELALEDALKYTLENLV